MSFMYFIGKNVYALLVYVPAFLKTGVIFPCSLRYCPFVPFFPKTPGRPSFPLIIAINQRILKYLLYLQNKQADSFVKKSFLISLDLNTTGKKSFHSNLMKISEYFKFWKF